MHTNQQAGFTLLEVLVALVIVGVALGASLRAVGSLTQNSTHLRVSMMSMWSAENRLAQIRLSKTWPDVGRSNFPCPQDDLQLLCFQEVSATPNPSFRRVQVSVFDERYPEHQLIQLTQVVPNAL
ncbi:MAG: gspI [Solimicrobium sp.]|jgi:general secretion pathway protein I|nr:gspI [Solimicrobium sp.]MCE3254198.1 gspI [Cellvibrio sp.]